jgi:uncharacterized protein (TIGR03118 family)
VAVFDLNGNLVRRLTAGGPLNAPWGLALAPRSFGQFGGALLVGNAGDGRISAFNPQTGAFLGQLADRSGVVIEIEGLWGLGFERKGGGEGKKLFFTSGPAGGTHGLLGYLQP